MAIWQWLKEAIAHKYHTTQHDRARAFLAPLIRFRHHHDTPGYVASQGIEPSARFVVQALWRGATRRRKSISGRWQVS